MASENPNEYELVNIDPISKDENVERVGEKLFIRSQLGINKYGTTTQRTDLSEIQWLVHAQEEALDFAVYLEALIQVKLGAQECLKSK